MIDDIAGLLLLEIQKSYSCEEFQEIDLVKVIVQLDLTHQLYLLMLLSSSFYDFEDEEALVRKSFVILVEFHKKMQLRFTAPYGEGSYEKLFNSTYTEYLDACLCFSNSFDESRVEGFKRSCEARRDGWRRAS